MTPQEERERQSTEAERERLLDEDFRKQWRKDDYPACDEGMVLLRRFAEAYPGVFGRMMLKGIQFKDYEENAKFPAWVNFTVHRTLCEKCAEK